MIVGRTRSSEGESMQALPYRIWAQPDSRWQVQAARRCRKFLRESSRCCRGAAVPASSSALAQVVALVRGLCADSAVHAIIVQRPLPKHIE